MSRRHASTHDPSFPRAFTNLLPAFPPQVCDVPTCHRMAVVEYGDRMCADHALLAIEFDTREAEATADGVSNEALPRAVSRDLAMAEAPDGQGDAGRRVATDGLLDSEGRPEPFRWDALPGRVETGIAVLRTPMWDDVKAHWAGMGDREEGRGIREERQDVWLTHDDLAALAKAAAAPESGDPRETPGDGEDPRETPIFPPCMGRCRTPVRYGGYCAACQPKAAMLREAFAGTRDEGRGKRDGTVDQESSTASPPRVETGLAPAPHPNAGLGWMFWLGLFGLCAALKAVLR